MPAQLPCRISPQGTFSPFSHLVCKPRGPAGIVLHCRVFIGKATNRFRSSQNRKTVFFSRSKQPFSNPPSKKLANLLFIIFFFFFPHPFFLSRLQPSHSCKVTSSFIPASLCVNTSSVTSSFYTHILPKCTSIIPRATCLILCRR